MNRETPVTNFLFISTYLLQKGSTMSSSIIKGLVRLMLMSEEPSFSRLIKSNINTLSIYIFQISIVYITIPKILYM